MPIPRHHEQMQACLPTDPGRQASPVSRSGRRALVAAALTTAVLAVGSAPALSQPVQPLRPVQHMLAEEEGAGAERVHQRLPSSTLEEAIRAAESQKGTPYVWGGTGPDGFDCSGLVQWSFQEAGVELPRVAHDQVGAGTKISYSEARRGDLLYWAKNGGYAYHIAIYLGEDRMIDAPHSGDHVRERDVTRHNLAGAVRL